jgi:hypothetical protein
MTHDQIIRVCKEVGRFYKKELSLGNCAVFAMALHKFLGGDSSDHFEAVVITTTDEEGNNAKEFIEHVVLVHDGHCYDSYGECNLNEALDDIVEDWDGDDREIDDASIYEYDISQYQHLLKGTRAWTKLSDMIRSFERAARRLKLMETHIKRFQSFINESREDVIAELQALKADESEPALNIKAMLLGESPAFTSTGPRHFKVHTPVPIPREYKIKYPDVCFTIQALQMHLNGYQYFKKWEELHQYLKIGKGLESMTVYRFWHTTVAEIERILDGGEPNLKSKSEYESFTRHSKLIGNAKGFSTLNVSTEELQQTHGRVPLIVSKHVIKPVFDISRFTVAMKNGIRKVFGNDIGIPYLHEREVIGPAVTVSRKDLLGYYIDAGFSTFDEKPMLVHGFKMTSEHLESIKKSLEKYGVVDMSMFGNSLIIMSDPSKSSMRRYVSGEPKPEKELSDYLGIDVWSGIWA